MFESTRFKNYNVFATFDNCAVETFIWYFEKRFSKKNLAHIKIIKSYS